MSDSSMTYDEKHAGQRRLYMRFHGLMRFFIRVMLHPVIAGKENLIEGPAVLCANHSSNLDGFIFLCLFPKTEFIRILVKKEVFSVPIVGTFMRKTGMIRVDRSIADVSPVRESMDHLKNGGKIALFPEGHRVSAGESSDAKIGAVKLAEKRGVPIMPIYIPRKKRLFRHNTIKIGEPYYINQEKVKLSAEDFQALSDELMKKIASLENSGAR